VILLYRVERASAILAMAAASAIVACSQPAPAPTPPPATAAPVAAPVAAPTPAPTTPPAAAAVSPVVKPVVAPSPAISPVAAASASPAAAPTPLSAAVLTAINPGLSSYMMEAAKRLGRSWFAAQDGNWDEAAFEIREAREVLDHGAIRGSSNQARQQAINAFNTGFFDPLIVAAQAGDKAAYEAGYNSAIQGCNACHASQTYGAINQPFSFIRVQVPKTSIWDVYAYAK
jgi:hypothetical protein